MTLPACAPALISPDQNTIRLKRLSILLSWVCLVLITALPILFIWFWAAASPAELAERVNLPGHLVQGPIKLWQRVAGGCVSMLPLGLLMAGLWQARKCLRLFAAGSIFTLPAVMALKRFAALATASFALSFLASTALSGLITLNNAPGTRQLVIGISTEQAVALFFAGLMWVMAAVMAQGLHLAEENANFV